MSWCSPHASFENLVVITQQAVVPVFFHDRAEDVQVAFFALGCLDGEHRASAQLKGFVIACGFGEPNSHKFAIFCQVMI